MSTNLYYLTDENGWYHNVIPICGEYCITRSVRALEAVVYTEFEMKETKKLLTRKRLKAYESEVLPRKKSGPKGKTKKHE